ncbi:MAG: response regulator, partial [Rhodospirillaceae bacterium]|nr:response regulator [Rhodospirillaceae bacterium]
RNPPDFLVVDDSIKPFDGVEMCARLRGGGPSVRFMPILLITSLPHVSLVERARDAGAHAVLAKPMSLKSLYSRITMILRERRPFIETDEYFGPDRRRRDMPYDGPNRRKAADVATGSAAPEEDPQGTQGDVEAQSDAA